MVKVYIMDICQLFKEETAVWHFQQLSEERQKKIKTYQQKEDRLRSLAAGIVMDRGLMDYHLREKEVNITYEKYGKPYLKEYPFIQFNLSHAGNYAIAGFGDRELGIDIEQIRRNSKGIVSRFFTELEQKYLKDIKEKESRQREFIRIWTRKESFIKAIGTGLSFGIDNVETCEELVDHTVILSEMEQNSMNKSQFWFFYEYKLEGYQISVCSKEDDFFEKLIWINI